MVEINIMYAFHYDHHVEFIANLVLDRSFSTVLCPNPCLPLWHLHSLIFCWHGSVFPNLMYTRNWYYGVNLQSPSQTSVMSSSLRPYWEERMIFWWSALFGWVTRGSCICCLAAFVFIWQTASSCRWWIRPHCRRCFCLRSYCAWLRRTNIHVCPAYVFPHYRVLIYPCLTELCRSFPSGAYSIVEMFLHHTTVHATNPGFM